MSGPSFGDAAGFGQPSIEHLWRRFNDTVNGYLGNQRNESLLRIKAAVQDFMKRSKTDHNINTEQIEKCRDLMVEIDRYMPIPQPDGEFPEEDQNKS